MNYMVITINPELDGRVQERAEQEGLSVDAYVERLIKADLAAEEELEYLALESLASGKAVQDSVENANSE